MINLLPPMPVLGDFAIIILCAIATYCAASAIRAERRGDFKRATGRLWIAFGCFEVAFFLK